MPASISRSAFVAAVPASALLWNASAYTLFPESFSAVRGSTSSFFNSTTL